MLVATAGYGVATAALAQSRLLALALAAGLLVGACDSLATTIRQATVQLETPDAMRGRVSSIYQMASRGGPALGDLNIGWLAGLLGPVAALTVGSAAPILYAGALYASHGRIARYSADADASGGGHDSAGDAAVEVVTDIDGPAASPTAAGHGHVTST
jgi:hypothetical protein